MLSDTLEFWIDLNLPPILVQWLHEDFDVLAKSFKELGLQTASDAEVFRLAKKQPNTIIITTKDYDFVCLAEKIGVPPKILYLNTGNISNKELSKLFSIHLRGNKNIF